MGAFQKDMLFGDWKSTKSTNVAVYLNVCEQFLQRLNGRLQMLFLFTPRLLHCLQFAAEFSH